MVKRFLTSRAYFENTASGDHYELTMYPLVDSEEFRTYELPLKIFQDEVELGLPRDYNWSTFFENLYLDIFPLPSGASISDIHLIVRYKPQNAFTLATQGGDIGRAKPGRSEGAFFPSGMASGDAYLNTGSGFQPMSRLEDVSPIGIDRLIHSKQTTLEGGEAIQGT